MTESRFSTPTPIGDELLSAYIDGQVTAAERQRVEQALATDAQVREQYETLQMTVNLMQDTPPVPVPRAFVLSEAQVLAAGGKVKGVKQPSFFDRLFPRLMPLATAAVAVLLVVLVSVDLLPGLAGGSNTPQPAMQAMEIAAAPAQDMATARELPKESATESAEEEAVEMAIEVESAALVEKEAIEIVADEELAKREDSAAGEAPAARAVAKSSNEANTDEIAEVPMAAAPPPAPEAEMVMDEAEPMLESAGGATESFGEESAVQAAQTTESASAPEIQATQVKTDGGRPDWLRPLEIILALLFVCLLVGTLLLRKRTRTDVS